MKSRHESEPYQSMSESVFNPRQGLTAEQLLALDELHRRLLESVRTPEQRTTGFILQEQLEWCDDMCKLRYLRARQYNVDKAEEMIRATLKWREEYKPHLITADDIFVELNNKGKMYVNGKDSYGRPVVYMKPRYDNTEEKVYKVKYMVYIMEQCCRMMDKTKGVEKVVWIIDHRDAPVMAGPARMSIVYDIIHIVQNHYPERLATSFHLDPPFLLHAFFRMINPLLDEVTRKKINFHSGPTTTGSGKQIAFAEYFTPDLYEEEYGGLMKFEYEPVSYAKKLSDEEATRMSEEFRKKIV